MCGICGWVAPRPSATPVELTAMLHALAPRGPDACGAWQDEEGCCVLGHRRLSIIDVAGSAQPMGNEDGSVMLSFNGEIYNYRELRARLRSHGHQFRTAGDSEVLVHLYEELGRDMLSELDGMFAFALYDRSRRTLLLARDRAGIKPLYVRHAPQTGELYFASTLGAMLAHPGMPRRGDRRALQQFLHFGYVVHPRSWVRDVEQLGPGECMTWRDGVAERHRYYAWEYRPASPAARTARAGELGTVLGTAVEAQLVADVPIASFLSGGLDSAAITGLADRALARRGEHLRSFTVRFADASLDESARARTVARELGTVHQEVDAASLAFERPVLDAIVDALGEPFGDASALAVYLLCGAVRSHVKVALSGDGGDELFLGYAGLRRQRLAHRLRSVPAWARTALQHTVAGAQGVGARRLRKYLALASHDGAGVVTEWARRWSTASLDELLGAQPWHADAADPAEPFPEIRAMIGDGDTGGLLEQQIRFHLLVDLPCDCLFKVDRMSMAHGLEVRVPLLANRLLEFGAHMPLAERHAGGRSKEPLRTLAESIAPSLRAPSAKQGFEFPLHAWMHATLAERWREWELSRVLGAVGMRPAYLESLVDRFAATTPGTDAYEAHWLAARLFDLLLLGLWSERHDIRWE